MKLKHTGIGICRAELGGRRMGFPAQPPTVRHRMEVSSPFGRARASRRSWWGTEKATTNPSSLSPAPRCSLWPSHGSKKGRESWLGHAPVGLVCKDLSNLPPRPDPPLSGFQQKYWDLDNPRYVEGFEFDIFPLSWAKTQGHFSIEDLWALSFYLWLEIRSDLKVPWEPSACSFHA